MKSLFVFAALLFVGCTDPSLQDPPLSTDQHASRFVGVWNIDQPTHALYEANFYRFAADGALTKLGAFSFGADCERTPTARACLTGVVSRLHDDLLCEFGSRWRSLDDSTLVIEGVCEDGLKRDILLSFVSAGSQNTVTGAEVVVTSVGGQSGWGRRFPEWRFLKCDKNGRVSEEHECSYVPFIP